MNKTLLHPIFWAIVIITLGLWLKPVKADPIVAFEQDGIRVVVYNEPCVLKESVTNLPVKATWTENGKTIEGCAQAFPQFGVAAFYFADKSIAVIPLSALQRLVGA